MKKTMLAILCASLVLSYGVVCAKTSILTVSKGGVNIVIDGRIIEPKDVTGSIVEPFIYEGTTYLPVRAVSEAFGLTVEWVESLRIISMDRAVEEIEIIENDAMVGLPPLFKKKAITEEVEAVHGNIILKINDEEVELKDESGKSVDIYLINGTNYLPVRSIAKAMGKDVIWDPSTATAYLGNVENMPNIVLEN